MRQVDRFRLVRQKALDRRVHRLRIELRRRGGREYECCLLYTSDAADERSSVDLGGRRIIKKKNRNKLT